MNELHQHSALFTTTRSGGARRSAFHAALAAAIVSLPFISSVADAQTLEPRTAEVVVGAPVQPAQPAQPAQVTVQATTAMPPLTMAPQYMAPQPYYPLDSRGRPLVIPYSGGPIPAGGHIETRVSGWVPAGGATFGALYLTSVFYAMFACPPGTSSCPTNSAYLYIPVIGPFITAADPTASYGGRNLAIFDGVLQAASLTTAIVAAFFPSRVIAYGPDPARRSTWQVAPGTMATAAGATVTFTHF